MDIFVLSSKALGKSSGRRSRREIGQPGRRGLRRRFLYADSRSVHFYDFASDAHSEEPLPSGFTMPKGGELSKDGGRLLLLCDSSQNRKRPTCKGFDTVTRKWV